MSNPLNKLLELATAPPPPEALEVPSFRWGVVESAAPLSVRLDGDTDPLASPPAKLVPVATGDRIFVVISKKKVTIIGKAQ
jgi:hypothetical protein